MSLCRPDHRKTSSRLDRHFLTLHSAALERLNEFKQRQKSTANGALNGLPIGTSCAHFPLFFFFPFSLSRALSLTHVLFLLHLPFFVFLILSRSFVASFPDCQLTQVVSRSGIYITCFFNINIQFYLSFLITISAPPGGLFRTRRSSGDYQE